MVSRRRFLTSIAASAFALAAAPALVPSSALAQVVPSRPATAPWTPRYEPTGRFEIQAFDQPYRQAGSQSWLARIYQPQGSGPFPALLEIHGGVWTDNDRTFDEPINKLLAATGVVVVAIDFRQGAADPYPSSLADINLATRWLKAHAADFNVDPRLIGGFGGSSGGHLIMLSAMRPRDPRYAELPLPEAPNADATLAYVIGHSPVVDPAARYELARQVNRADLITRHDGFFGSVQTMEECSPTKMLQRQEQVELPPMLVLHGTADLNVPVGHVEQFADAYRAAAMRRQVAPGASPEEATAAYRATGGVLELQEFPGMPHYFLHPAVAKGTMPERGIQVLEEFIARQVTRITG